MDLLEPVFVTQGAFARLSELRKLLADSGIPAEIVKPPGANANA